MRKVVTVMTVVLDHALAIARNQGVGPVVAAAVAEDGLTHALILAHVLEVPIDVVDLVLILVAETHSAIAVEIDTRIRTTTIIVEADIPSAVVVAAAAAFNIVVAGTGTTTTTTTIVEDFRIALTTIVLITTTIKVINEIIKVK